MRINPISTLSRRNFIGMLAASGVAWPVHAGLSLSPKPEESISIHMFSKHLYHLDYAGMAEAAAETGFDGIDLTVRPNGYIKPDQVEDELPKAVEALKKQGLRPLMMSTAIASATDEASRKLLKNASQLGIKYYRPQWLRYQSGTDLRQELSQHEQQLQSLSKLNREMGIYGSYQNHSGSNYVGAPIWDVAMMLHTIKSEYMGLQYDIRHAVAEGGLSWPLGLQLVHPHINSLVVKDCRWEKVKGTWKVVNTPLGEGMVDFKKFFSLVKEYRLRVPITLHYEYEMPVRNIKETIVAMRKDLTYLQNHLRESELLK